MLGAVIFAIATAAFPLARRLEESEALAHQRGIDLANLAQLNEYIIRNLRESIVVVDAANNIRLINQPAAEHLGTKCGQPASRCSGCRPELSRLLESWRRGDDARRQLPAFVSADGSMQINTYIAPLEGREDGPVLIFLEDAGMLAEKVQQSKLAALGRLTASIAHEVRNPVGAMSHAGQLLEESPAIGQDERRLISIIRTNSPAGQRDRRQYPAALTPRGEQAADCCPCATGRAHSSPSSPPPWSSSKARYQRCRVTTWKCAWIPGHLHQIIWNLCENAVKYASEAAGGIAVELSWGRMPGSRRPYLEVADRGPGIPGGAAGPGLRALRHRAERRHRASACSSPASSASAIARR